MSKKINIILIVTGLILFLVGGMLIRSIDVLKPVTDANGTILHDINGKIIFEHDTWKNITANWDAYSLMSVGIVLLFASSIWIICRSLKTK
jgi:hypothetical protein